MKKLLTILDVIQVGCQIRENLSEEYECEILISNEIATSLTTMSHTPWVDRTPSVLFQPQKIEWSIKMKFFHFVFIYFLESFTNKVFNAEPNYKLVQLSFRKKVSCPFITRGKSRSGFCFRGRTKRGFGCHKTGPKDYPLGDLMSASMNYFG